jgi:hypothetical protein
MVAKPAPACTLIQVADVAPAEAALPEVSFKAGVESLTNAPPEDYEPDPLLTRPVEACARYHGRLVAEVYYHPVIAAIHRVFHDHRPLVLSPDIIWLLIVQGFAHHVNAHAETLRAQLVGHAGKLLVEVRRDDFIKGSPENPWPEVFDEFTSKIREHVGAATHDLLLPAFSTTGAVEKAAAQVVLLDAMQSYFSYRCCSGCGIPQIMLEGTTDDWLTLAERTEGLARFGLKWWTEALMPILREFVAAARGNAKRDFWQSVYKLEQVSGGNRVTGWITVFFPYFQDYETGRVTLQNPWLAAHVDRRRPFAGGPTTMMFVSGLSRAPFVWRYLGRDLQERKFDMEFLGGFVGVAQDAATLRLRPEIGWAVRDLATVRSFEKAVEAAARAREAALERANAERVAQARACAAREEEKRRRATVQAPPWDPDKPRHDQFFRLVCPFCGHQEEIGLWFPYKACSRCKKGIYIERQ